MTKSLPMNHQQEVHQLNDSHFWEINLPQYVIVVVVGHNVSCVSLYGTVNELVVVGVGCDEVEMIIWIDTHHMLALQDSADDSIGKLWSEISAQNFLIFKKNLIGDTQGILSAQDRQPYAAIHTVISNTG